MARNKIQITPENSAEWLASCGFLFPTNKKELDRFNKLFGDIDPSITGNEVDPFKIIKGSEFVAEQKSVIKKLDIPDTQYQMVARKLSDLPEHIVDRIKKNQENKKDNNADAGEKKSDQ
jgi:uncharacterized coiled-coil protein SlyX